MSEPSSYPVGSPREVLDRVFRYLQTRDMDAYADLHAEDAVSESVFASPGDSGRMTGREQIRARLKAAHQMFPMKIDGFDSVVVHETLDPEVLIAEYNMSGRLIETNREFRFSDLLIMRVREGRIVSMRAYTNPLAIAETLGMLPRLVERLSGDGRPD
ncbi:nuclear transport factor 2 family protein [Cohnella zeiphila]|uniref:Nuclear transport factor 2 family protein n=1 Tax=Cohnella zeiphila TaxID=2761120 RepID=A0A7X0SPZ6_9BACL|nr:nuclear transport factor 2 family protein [Cohnella zeiphila]MBB6733951.1 nuclear transport factor 2 family protein [Cohnella zeiphila]